QFMVSLTAPKSQGAYHSQWQVHSANIGDLGPVIDVWFTVPEAPPAPSLSSPADGASVPSNVGANAQPLSANWSSVSGAQCYDVQVATDSGFTNLLNDSSLYPSDDPNAPPVCSFGGGNNNGVVRGSTANILGLQQWSETQVAAPFSGG